MKLKIDNSAISQLFVLVQQIQEVKAMIENQEAVLVCADETLAELRKELKEVDAEVAHRAKMLRDGSQSALQELLSLQWRQQEAAKQVSVAEMNRAGIEANLSLLDTELIGYQKQVDCVLQGHKS